MACAVWTGLERLEIVQNHLDHPVLKHREVRLRITAAGVCRTDVHIWEGRLPIAKPPLVLGHEFTGIVEECGPEVQGLSVGDRVKCDSVVGCGHCGWCRKGATQFCRDGWEFGISCDGGWATTIVVPERNLHRLPANVSDEAAAILDVEVPSAFRKPGLAKGETVAVIGAGPAGLVALQYARLQGAGCVILSDMRPERLELGKRLGADHVINVSECDFEDAVNCITNHQGVDLAFDAAGSPRSICDTLHVLRPQGRAVLYGIPDTSISSFPHHEAILRDIAVYGSLPDRVGWQELIQWVASGAIDLESLITHRFELRDAPKTMPLMRDYGDGIIKCVLLINP